MHRQALSLRRDINAVVHAHPTYASTFTALNKPINTRLLAEAWFLLEEPAVAPYVRMGTTGLADEVATCLKHSNVVLMENHGVLTVGKTLVEAFDLIEVLENSAQMTFISETLAATGRGWEVRELSGERQAELMRMKRGAMKYELQTIPVWDGVRSGSECFLCDLMVKALSDSVDYYLGSSVMDEETRLLVNRRGFCPPHWEALIDGGVPHALALISHTHLGERLKKLDFNPNRKKRPNSINEEGKGCLICEKMEKRLLRYTFTIAYMWRKEEGVQEELLGSKGFCLYHLGHLLGMASEPLGERGSLSSTHDE